MYVHHAILNAVHMKEFAEKWMVNDDMSGNTAQFTIWCGLSAALSSMAYTCVHSVWRTSRIGPMPILRVVQIHLLDGFKVLQNLAICPYMS